MTPHPIGRRSPFQALPFRAMLLLLFAVLVCARMPEIVLHGRFWAEEGRFFFFDAWTMRWEHALLTPVGGYLNIVANAAGVLAQRVPLRDAPFVTIAIALLFQSLPAVVLLTARDAWLEPPFVLLGAVLVVAVPAAADEVWLNSIHSQFHLALADAIILALQPATGAVGRFRLLLLLLGPLAGPTALFLLPLFGLRFLSEPRLARSWRRWRLMQLGCLALGTAVQLLLFFQHTAGRSYGIGLRTLVCVFFVKQLAVPFLGHDIALRLGRQVHDALAAGRPLWRILMLTCGLFGLFAVMVLRTRVAAARWLFASATLIAILGFYGAIDGRLNLVSAEFGQRYAIVPMILFTLCLLALLSDQRQAIRMIVAILLLWIIAAGLRDEASPHPDFFARGPDWAEAVARWKLMPDQSLAIWPKGWTMFLPPR